MNYIECEIGVGAKNLRIPIMFAVSGDITLKMFAMLFFALLKESFVHTISLRRCEYWFSARVHIPIIVMNDMNQFFKVEKKKKVYFILHYGKHWLVTGSNEELKIE